MKIITALASGWQDEGVYDKQVNRINRQRRNESPTQECQAFAFFVNQ